MEPLLGLPLNVELALFGESPGVSIFSELRGSMRGLDAVGVVPGVSSLRLAREEKEVA